MTIALHFMLKQKWVTNHGWVVMTAANLMSATNVHPVCLNSNGLVMASLCFVFNVKVHLGCRAHINSLAEWLFGSEYD